MNTVSYFLQIASQLVESCFNILKYYDEMIKPTLLVWSPAYSTIYCLKAIM